MRRQLLFACFACALVFALECMPWGACKQVLESDTKACRGALAMAQQEGYIQQQSSCCRNKSNNHKNNTQQKRQQQGQQEQFVESSSMPGHAAQVGATQSLWCLQRFTLWCIAWCCAALVHGVHAVATATQTRSPWPAAPGRHHQRPPEGRRLCCPASLVLLCCPPLFFFASLNTSGYNYSNHTARPRATLSSRKLPPPHRTSPIPTFQICLRGHGQQGAGGRLYANAQGDTAREAQHQELQHEVPPSSHCHVGLPGTCASLRLFSCLPHPLAPLFDFLASACKAVDAWKGRGGPRSWPRLARFNR